MSGRESVKKLSGTVGTEMDKEVGRTYIWKPCFQMQDKDEKGSKGNNLKTWMAEPDET